MARYAFDLGNLSFANGWVGWWAVAAGVGQVLARAIWTNDFAFVPFTAFWLWTAVVSVLLLRGRLATAETS